jgi:hypothetical protein
VRVRLAIAIGLVLVAGMVALGLFRSVHPATGDNGREIQLPAGIGVLPGQQACQGRERVPAGTGLLRVIASTAGKSAGPLSASVRAGGRTVARGTSSAGFSDSGVEIPITRQASEIGAATVCVRNAGTLPVAILGQNAPRDEAAVVSGDPAPPHGSMRLEWFEPETHMHIASASDIARRYPLAKASFFGTWTLWAALALLVAASGAGIVLVAREAGRER